MQCKAVSAVQAVYSAVLLPFLMIFFFANYFLFWSLAASMYNTFQFAREGLRTMALGMREVSK